MHRYTLLLIVALVGCTTSAEGVRERSRDNEIVLIAADTLIHASDSTSLALAWKVDAVLEGLNAALENGLVTMRRYARTPSGLLPVADTAATPTDFGVVVDAGSLVIAAVLGEPPFSNSGPFTTYIFDEQGRTIGIEVDYTDWENGCAELLAVELRWVLRDGGVVQYSRRLRDQDEYAVSSDECVVGVGMRRTVLRSWRELARSVGMAGDSSSASAATAKP